jgi:hypothetical protein
MVDKNMTRRTYPARSRVQGGIGTHLEQAYRASMKKRPPFYRRKLHSSKEPWKTRASGWFVIIAGMWIFIGINVENTGDIARKK